MATTKDRQEGGKARRDVTPLQFGNITEAERAELEVGLKGFGFGSTASALRMLTRLVVRDPLFAVAFREALHRAPASMLLSDERRPDGETEPVEDAG